MPKNIGKPVPYKWFQWFVHTALWLFFGCLAVLGIVGGGALWLIAFTFDFVGHWQRFKNWRRERAIIRSLK